MATNFQNSKYFSFSSRAQYKIHVQGHIDDSWSDRLGGLAIFSSIGDDNKPITTLEGAVTDQAELLGILNSIYEMHLPLLSVTYVKDL